MRKPTFFSEHPEKRQLAHALTLRYVWTINLQSCEVISEVLFIPISFIWSVCICGGQGTPLWEPWVPYSGCQSWQQMLVPRESSLCPADSKIVIIFFYVWSEKLMQRKTMIKRSSKDVTTRENNPSTPQTHKIWFWIWFWTGFSFSFLKRTLVWQWIRFK